MELLKKELVFLDQDLKSRDDVFSFIANKAMENGVITNAEALVKGFLNREVEGSTGFEDGFAIPHTRIKEAKTAAVVVVRLKEGVDWYSIDGKPTDVAIALIVPDGQGNQHMELLSEVATKLMSDSFKKQIHSAKTIEDVIKAFEVKKETTKSVQKTKDGLNIIAITACITGVAHTYMAEEKLLKAGAQMGHHIRVETHGSKGVGTPFSKKEINDADVVIFAVDTNVDKSRFAGKKQYEIKVSKAINNPEAVINDAIAKGQISGENEVGEIQVKQQRESVMKHIMAGISYMIPVVVLGGICLAFSLGIAKAIWGPGADPSNGGKSPWGILNVLNIIGGVAFALMIPILAGFIANSISGRAAIAPAMVAAFIGNDNTKLMPWPNIPGLETIQTPMGFIGAILAGLAAGYMVKWINTWKVPRALQAAMPIFFIPLFVGIVLSLVFIYVLGSPIGYVMNKIQYGIERGYGYNPDTGEVSTTLGIGVGLGLGLILGAMGGLDMGGPVNKIAFVTCSLLTTMSATQTNPDAAAVLQRPMGSLACAIPVAPLGMGVATFVAPKFFDRDTKNLGVGAFIMGCIGISEGAIPFAIRDPKRVFACNVIGSAVAGALGGALGVQDAAAHGGPIVAILGAVPYGVQTLYFFIAAAVGVAITSLLYVFWLLNDAGKPGSVKERHVQYLDQITNSFKDFKLDTKDQIIEIKNKKAAEVKQLKNEGKDFSSVIAKYDAEIINLKNAIVNAKKDLIAKKQRAKVAYKEIAKRETADLRGQKDQIKTVKLNAKSEYQNMMKKIANEKENKPTFKNKAEQINFHHQIHGQKVAAKNALTSSIIQDQTTRRHSYVNEYNKAVA